MFLSTVLLTFLSPFLFQCGRTGAVQSGLREAVLGTIPTIAVDQPDAIGLFNLFSVKPG